MRLTVNICLVVAIVFILGVGRLARASPLIEAAKSGDTDQVQALLAKDADVKAKNNKGHTAMMLAQQEGDKEIIQLLKKAGANE